MLNADSIAYVIDHRQRAHVRDLDVLIARLEAWLLRHALLMARWRALFEEASHETKGIAG
jgi:hypothetical protein